MGKRDRGRSENDWSLAVVQLSLGIWDLGCFPLLLSLEIFTSRTSELCLSETVGLRVGSAPEFIDCDRHRVVELLLHSAHSVRR